VKNQTLICLLDLLCFVEIRRIIPYFCIPISSRSPCPFGSISLELMFWTLALLRISSWCLATSISVLNASKAEPTMRFKRSTLRSSRLTTFPLSQMNDFAKLTGAVWCLSYPVLTNPSYKSRPFCRIDDASDAANSRWAYLVILAQCRLAGNYILVHTSNSRTSEIWNVRQTRVMPSFPFSSQCGVGRFLFGY